MKSFLKELHSLLWIVTGFAIISSIILLFEDENNLYLFFSLILIYIITLALSFILTGIFKNKVVNLIFRIIIIPFNFIRTLLGFMLVSSTVLMYLFFYLGICIVVQKGITNLIYIFDSKNTISFDNYKYLGLTITALLAVLLNNPIRYLINIFLLKIPVKYFKFKYDIIETIIKFIFNKENIKFLINIFYAFILTYSTFNNFQNEIVQIFQLKSEIIVKSFVTFIAFDKAFDLAIKLDFRPSKFVNLFKSYFD